MVRYARGTRTKVYKGADQAPPPPTPAPPTGRGIAAVAPLPTALGGACRELARTTTTPSPHCTARAPRTVGRLSIVRYARGTRAKGLKRAEYDISNPPSPNCRGVYAVAPRPTAWGGAHRVFAHNTTTPSPRCAARAPRAVSRFSMVRYARGMCATGFKRAGKRTFDPPAADLSRCWCSQAPADGVGRSAPRVRPQHNHAKSALRGACFAGRRPLLHGTRFARDACHGIQTRWPGPLESRAAGLSRCWCG